MSVEDYLASIDWVGAVVVGALLIVIGLVLLRFLTATTSEMGSMLPGARDAAGRALLDVRGQLPVESWVCVVCRSVNVPTATHCYRGCGPREAVGHPFPVPGSAPGPRPGAPPVPPPGPSAGI